MIEKKQLLRNCGALQEEDLLKDMRIYFQQWKLCWTSMHV